MTRNASTFRSGTRMQYTIGFKREFAITINVDTSSIKSDVLPKTFDCNENQNKEKWNVS